MVQNNIGCGIHAYSEERTFGKKVALRNMKKIDLSLLHTKHILIIIYIVLEEHGNICKIRYGKFKSYGLLRT